MTLWDILGFIVTTMMSIILALIGFIVSGLKDRLKELQLEHQTTEREVLKVKIDISERLHRDEWERYKASQEQKFEAMIDKLSDIREMLSKMQGKCIYQHKDE